MIYRRGGPLATDRFQPASGLRILRAGEDGEGLEPAAVSAAVRARLAGYKVPRTVLIAPVPRAPNGKVLVEAARRLFSADGPRTGAPCVIAEQGAGGRGAAGRLRYGGGHDVPGGDA
jgi:hypothetical protein